MDIRIMVVEFIQIRSLKTAQLTLINVLWIYMILLYVSFIICFRKWWKCTTFAEINFFWMFDFIVLFEVQHFKSFKITSFATNFLFLALMCLNMTFELIWSISFISAKFTFLFQSLLISIPRVSFAWCDFLSCAVSSS